MKKVYIMVLLPVLLLLTACSGNNNSGATKNNGIEITNIVSSIGAVDENTNNIDTQSFKYAMTLTNNDAIDIKIVSVSPVLSNEFLNRVDNKETRIEVNKTITNGSSINITGEIIFDAKGLTKEQIDSLQPFIKDVKILEERIINKSF